MKTFLEFAKEKNWNISEEIDNKVGKEIVAIGNTLSKSDEEIMPGMTKPQKIKQVMNHPKVASLAKKSPEAAGQIAAYLSDKEKSN